MINVRSIKIFIFKMFFWNEKPESPITTRSKLPIFDRMKNDKLIPSTFLNFNAHIIGRMTATNMKILNLISECREIRDVGKKSKLLEYINQLLPSESKIKLPSLITNDGIDNLLSWLEVKISPPTYGLATS
jgi:hypothetical protein